MMGSYKYYSTNHRGRGNKDTKKEKDSDPNLFFII